MTESRSRNRAVLAGLLMTAGVLAACGSGSDSTATADDDGTPGTASPALVRSADDRAHRAGLVMLRDKRASGIDLVRPVVAGDPARGTAIEALVAEGDRFSGRIVLRITEVSDSEMVGAVPMRTVRCYEYDLDNSTRDIDPAPVDCPDLPALAIPDATPPPTVPTGIDEALLAALQQLAAAHGTADDVRAQVSSLAAGAAVFDVTAAGDGAIGVVVGNGDDECVSGRIAPDGMAEVWRVPTVIAQPGELGCSAAAAAAAEGKESPH